MSDPRDIVGSADEVSCEVSAETMAVGCAWIEGAYVPIAEARIPLMDWGFLHSDATYDVVSVWEGSFFRLEDHLERLENSRRLLRLSSPLTTDEIRDVLVGLVRCSGLRQAYVQAINTRGLPPVGSRDPREMRPAFYAFAIPYQWILAAERHYEGLDLVIAREGRRIPPDAVDPTVKRLQWGDLVQGMFEAYDRGALIPLLTDGEGHVTEGPGFNVFVVLDGTLHTPAVGVLQGITRRTAIELANEDGIRVRVENVSVKDIADADEVFVTSTAGGIIPVGTVDGAQVGPGGIGPITHRLRSRYWEIHRDGRYLTAVDYKEPEDGAATRVV